MVLYIMIALMYARSPCLSPARLRLTNLPRSDSRLPFAASGYVTSYLGPSDLHLYVC